MAKTKSKKFETESEANTFAKGFLDKRGLPCWGVREVEIACPDNDCPQWVVTVTFK